MHLVNWISFISSSIYLVLIRVSKRNVKFSPQFITMALSFGNRCQSSNPHVKSIFGKGSIDRLRRVVGTNDQHILDAFLTIDKIVRWNSVRGRTIVRKWIFSSIEIFKCSIWNPMSHRMNGKSLGIMHREIRRNTVNEEEEVVREKFFLFSPHTRLLSGNLRWFKILYHSRTAGRLL